MNVAASKIVPEARLEALLQSDVSQLVNIVVDVPTLAVVRQCLEAREKLEVVILGSLKVGGFRAQDEASKVVGEAVVEVYHIVLENVRSFTQEPDGSFWFAGTTHTSYSWERNYNAGHQTEHTYTHYKLWVDKQGLATYEVISKEERSSR